eukprot:352904-Chlamydomonas_euryale.AAC.3
MFLTTRPPVAYEASIAANPRLPPTFRRPEDLRCRQRSPTSPLPPSRSLTMRTTAQTSWSLMRATATTSPAVAPAAAAIAEGGHAG